jgi:hypothetical protein
MQVHLVPRSDVLRYCDTQNEAFRHAVRDLGTISVCEDQLGEEAWYLAQQTEEAIMCISMCIIVTDVYAVTWRISCDWSQLIGRSQICLLLSGMAWRTLLMCWVCLRSYDSGWMSLYFLLLTKLCRLDLENLSWWLFAPVRSRQWLMLTMIDQSLFKFLDSEC